MHVSSTSLFLLLYRRMYIRYRIAHNELIYDRRTEYFIYLWSQMKLTNLDDSLQTLMGYMILEGGLFVRLSKQ